MTFPYDELALQYRLKDLQIALLRSGGKRRRALNPEEQAVQDFGRALFNALMTGEIRNRYDLSRLQVQQQHRGLRLKLRFQAAELAALPWEFLFDERRREYLCLSKDTPPIRYLELPQPILPLTVSPPLRVLGIVASPADRDKLDEDRERQRIEAAFKHLRDSGVLELEWLPGQSWRHLQRAMRHGPWHILHFIGHGGFDSSCDEGCIALVNDSGQQELLRATQLARLLAGHPTLRLVLLNACEGAKGSVRDIFSSSAAILVQSGIPAVVAMQYEITDRAAIAFSQVFYEALADGLPVDAAVTEARVAVNIGVNNSLEWGTPVLYMRSPDGVLFELAALPTARPEPVIDETMGPPEWAAAPGQEALEPGSEAAAAKSGSAPETKVPPMPGKSLLPRIGAALILAVVWLMAGWWLLPITDKSPPRFQEVTKPVPPPPAEMKAITNSIGMTFVLIPAGTFQMGSPAGEAGRNDDERQHQVTISKPFFLQTTEVTQGQWQKVMGSNPAYFNKCGKDCPVEQVSWDDAQEFIKKLNLKESTKTYRLPTEAEWEWACRANSTGRFSCGDDEAELKEYAWSNQNSAGKTHPAGQLQPNAWGLYDMHGNVREWCQEWYGPYSDKMVPDPEGPGPGKGRVLRGGSWNHFTWYVRSAVRGKNVPDIRDNLIGFRVARTL